MSKRKHFAALALGGVGRIGMNMMVYECDGKYIVVDAGVSFGDETTPGVDVIIPDTRFLREHAKDIVGVFITHAHEDHIGGIGYMWDDFGGAPVFATRFSRLSMENKLRELGIKPAKGEVNTAKPGETIEVGPFKVEYVGVAHSIPEAFGLAITTHYGTVVHTGDYKFDEHAPFGQQTDEKRWKAIGKQGVLAVLGDSTGIFAMKPSGSEKAVFEHLDKLIGESKQRVFFAAFASHVGRALNVAEIAMKHGRKVCFLGRTVNKMLGYAKELGYTPAALKGYIVEAEEASKLPPHKVLVFASGTQGEPAASLTRLSQGQEVRGLRIDEGDTVILSSRMIPGNERAILNTINGLYVRGAEVVTELTDRETHVSGHASRPEIQHMYSLLKPTYVVPVHGEPGHLTQHARCAEEWGYKPLQLTPGHKLVLAPETPFTQPHAYAHGYNYIDGLNILDNDALPVKERRKLSYDGVVSAALAIRATNGEWLGELSLSTKGLLDERLQKDILDRAAKHAMKALDAVFPDALIDEPQRAREVIGQSLRKSFKQERGKSPTVLVQFIEV
ncbi:MAG: ribonuclease J [Pseudomonadaceae bacterium]|nr:ribonuclease J [Pseudomonadaceae bacterium]